MASNNNNDVTSMPIEELNQAILEQITQTDTATAPEASNPRIETEGATDEVPVVTETGNSEIPISIPAIIDDSGLVKEVGMVSGDVGVTVVDVGDKGTEVDSVVEKVLEDVAETFVVDGVIEEKSLGIDAGTSVEHTEVLAEEEAETPAVEKELVSSFGEPLMNLARAISQEREKVDSTEDWLNEDDDVQVLETSGTPKSKAKSSRKRKAPETAVKARIMPDRPGKRQSTAKVADDKSIIEEWLIEEEFFTQNQLGEVYDLLKFQGWTHLFAKAEEVDKDEVLEFYRDVSKKEMGKVVVLNYKYRGQPLIVTSKDLENDFMIRNTGFELFTKGTWPKGTTEDEKVEMQRRVCNYANTSLSDLSSHLMNPVAKILHRLLVQTILPRGSKTAFVQIHDVLVLNKILQKEEVNLAKLIIHQMDYVSKLKHVGHARFVKRILQEQGVYKAKSEVSISRPLSVEAVKRWDIVQNDELVWVRKPIKTQDSKVIDKEVRGSVEPDLDIGVAERLVNLEKGLWDVKDTLAQIQKDVKDLTMFIAAGFADLKNPVVGTGSRT